MIQHVLSTNPFAADISAALESHAQATDAPHHAPHREHWQEQHRGELPSWFAVTDLAAAAIGAATSNIAALVSERAQTPTPKVTIDRRLASLWFGWSISPSGWSMPAPWDPLAGDYQAQDGWIKLHTNAPHHRHAALKALGLDTLQTPEPTDVAQAVSRFSKDVLEARVIGLDGCAAAMHSMSEWQSHPQGKAVAAEPLILWTDHTQTTGAAKTSLEASIDYPLQGLKVLDLTRVLAGPVASRFLARFGANVLRIDPLDWEEPGVVPEVTLGKRCAGLDLKTANGRAQLKALLQDADILLHGYRPGALDNLGLGRGVRASLNPNLIDVSLSAYGHSGPWAQRRGFDSLVQMSCGIADWGMRQAKSAVPSPLPVQALDHATGYLMAAATIRGLRERYTHGRVLQAQLSLARTGLLLSGTGGTSLLRAEQPQLTAQSSSDLDSWPEATAWGPARRLKFPAHIDGLDTQWQQPAVDLRSSKPSW